ncbi:unnamed protein product [Notodromas monacha]|uniref:RRP12-like protein n=1 Tax=Notodromas monacha TaxID=399045 RepID=A0A7R9GE27_9CRUS|nr:unnamed protein product [Notodromas monacha]CAG0917825.1 unnamed protein product [Notodromas monacha]
MGRVTARVKGRKKGKRWAKGQSSSSNPETRKFRSRVTDFTDGFVEETRRPNTTASVEGLQLDLLSLNDGKSIMSTAPSVATKSVQSLGGRTRYTAATFASDWSQTSNVTFNRFLKNFQPTSENHREMLALLEAATEVIRDRNGEESDTEYFCTLVTAFDVIEDEGTLAAIAPFSVMLLKNIRQEFLQNKFEVFSKVFLKVLSKHAGSQSTSLLRGAITCLAVLLRNQEANILESSACVELFAPLLAFIIHPKPKVRKAAQHQVAEILIITAGKTESKPSSGTGPLGNAAAKFVKFRLEEGISDPNANLTSTLHVLEFCRRTLRCFPPGALKSICELIVQLMSLNNVVVKKLCVEVLKDFVSESDLEVPFSAKTLGQLLVAVWDVKPSGTDAVLLPPWLTLVKQGILTLHKLDEDLAFKHLHKFLPFMSSCWTTDNHPITVAASCAFSGLLKRAIQPSIEKLIKELETRGKSESILGTLETCLTDGLKFQAYKAWPLVFQLWSQFFETCGSACIDITRLGLCQLGEMRTSFEVEERGGPEVSTGTRTALGNALGNAVRVLGPKLFLSGYPLEITGREPFGKGLDRSWILPVLRDNLVVGCPCELEYFTAYFIPLAEIFYARSQGAIPRSPISDKKVYGVLCEQVWSLFPGFCNSAKDVSTSFPKIAQTLGTRLKTRPDLITPIVSGLKNIAEFAARNGGSDITAVAVYAKNFLPLFFVKVLEPNTSVDIRDRLLNAIKAFTAIAKESVICGLSEKALAEVLREAEDEKRKAIVYDLCIALAPHIPDSAEGRDILERLLNHALELSAKSEGLKSQKKGYRILDTLCRGESALERKLVTERRSDIVNTIVVALSKSTPIGKSARLKCVARLMEMELSDDVESNAAFNEEDKDFLTAAIGEALLCIRDSKKATRAAAFDVVVKATTFLKLRLKCSDEEAVKGLLGYLLAGLAGTPQMIACSLLALGHVCYTMNECFPADNLEPLIDNACLLITTASREIVGAALSFFRVLFKSYPPGTMVIHLAKIVIGLSGAKNDPVLDKRLKNIRRALAKEKRKRAERPDADSGEEIDSDAEIDTMTSKSRSRLSLARSVGSVSKGVDKAKSIAEILANFSDDDSMPSDAEGGGGDRKRKASRKSKQDLMGKAWIHENPDEQIVDLLDASASRHILAADPDEKKSKKPKKTKDNFALSTDGRLIIDDSDEDVDSENLRGKKRKMTASRSGILSGIDSKSKSTTLRETFDGEDELRDFGDDDDKSVASASTRTSVGIHRRTKKVKKTAPEPYLGSEYKGKKGMGDVKRKGLPDPYAYFPLARDALNKRYVLPY